MSGVTESDSGIIGRIRKVVSHYKMRMRKAETSFEDRSRSCLGARGEGMLNGLISKGFVACNSVTVVPHSNKKIKFVHVWSRYV